MGCVAPATLRRDHNVQRKHAGVRARNIDMPGPPLSIAARECFWNIPCGAHLNVAHRVKAYMAAMAYMAHRVKNKCGHTVPQKIVYTVGAAVKLLEMPQLPLTSALIQGLVQGHLKSRTTETKRAPPISVNMLVMLERGFHIHKAASNATALICGIWLFLVNTSMRFADSGWINPWKMRFGSVQTTKGEETVLRGRCSKAKSDQLGIRSQFACPNFYLTTPWLVEWYEKYILFPHESADVLFPSIALRAGKVKVDFSRGADYKECAMSIAFSRSG